jgi:hypothetical protein
MHPPSKRSILSIALASLGMLSVLAVNAHLNANAKIRCNSSIYTLGAIQTSVGPSYKCISRAQLVGPTAPIRD